MNGEEIMVVGLTALNQLSLIMTADQIGGNVELC